MLVRTETTASEMPDYGRTFPMYVPAIDWYFLQDDHKNYPMVFYLDLDFSGKFESDKLTIALRDALFRHPLLFSVMQPAKQDRLCWVLAPDKMPAIDWDDADVPLGFEDGDYIDIRNTPGLRIWVRESDDSTHMTLQFHHSACDGTGAYRFVGDLLACYMQQLPSCEGKVELGDFNPAQLKVRATKLRSFLMTDSSLSKLRAAVAHAWHHMGTLVAPLRAPATKPSDKVLPGMVKEEFTAQQLTNLRAAATSQGATLNDLFLCKMFQAANAWNQGKSSGRKFRILVPADMRDGHDFEMPACNMTACTFITRKRSEISDETQLLDLVRQDTLKIKNGEPQSSFMNAVTSAMSGKTLTWIMKRNKCLATCVVSNAGDPARRFTCKLPKSRGKVSCDEFTLESVSGVPPLRRNTRSTLSVSIYGRKLTISMRCDPFLFGEKESRELLGLFCDQLRPLAQ